MLQFKEYSKCYHTSINKSSVMCKKCSKNFQCFCSSLMPCRCQINHFMVKDQLKQQWKVLKY